MARLSLCRAAPASGVVTPDPTQKPASVALGAQQRRKENNPMTDRMPGVGETINLAGVDYRLEELIAVQWNPGLAAAFPNASHEGCRQVMERRDDGWHPCVPARCVGYHCPRCGEGTGSFGHNDCPAAVEGNHP